MSIVIVDYGAGNLASLARGLSAAGGEVRLARSASDAIGAKAIVIPGVGHFSATSALGDDWKGAIRDHLARGGALLGVCLGMQWLFEGSDEAPDTAGLGLLRGRAVRLTGPVKVPHSGWNSVLPVGESRILGGTDNCWAYFTHSFALPVSAEGVAGVTTHGDAFAAVIERGRVWGLQYHPELSGSAGAEQLRRFVSLVQGNACAVPGPPGSTQIRQTGAARRLIACLDVRDGAVVKGVNFEQLRNAGDPAELARRYNREGIDELVLLDVTATTEARATRASTVTRVARELSVPFAVGGGIRELNDARCLMEAGSDKVCVNSAALDRPALIGELERLYGSQAVVVAIDAKREAHSYRVFGRSGAVRDGREAVSWAREAEARGAGEILLTSIDRDGTRDGFDCELTAAVSDAVSIPVIASGGAGRAEHFAEVFTTGRADAALAASVFHYQDCSIRDLKQQLAGRGIPVRPC